jgi:hypothetical protein
MFLVCSILLQIKLALLNPKLTATQECSSRHHLPFLEAIEDIIATIGFASSF